MGLFDFIGDAFGAITAPFTAVIDAGTKLLGLPPVIGDALKIAVGAATGDFVTLMQGSTQLLKDLAASAAETEYAPAEGRGLRRHRRMGSNARRSGRTARRSGLGPRTSPMTASAADVVAEPAPRRGCGRRGRTPRRRRRSTPWRGTSMR